MATQANAEESETELLEIPVTLDPLCAVLQHAIANGDFTTDHVAYQSLYHLLMGGVGGGENGLLKQGAVRDHVNDFGTLRSWQESVLLNGRRRMLGLVRGGGRFDRFQPTNAREYFSVNNFGGFSADTIAAGLPPTYTSQGVQVEDVLNFIAGCRANEALQYKPDICSDGKMVIPVAVQLDGWLIGIGLDVDPQRKCVVGLADKDLYITDVLELCSSGKLDVKKVRLFST
jgi:hypothetical protein